MKHYEEFREEIRRREANAFEFGFHCGLAGGLFIAGVAWLIGRWACQ